MGMLYIYFNGEGGKFSHDHQKNDVLMKFHIHFLAAISQ